MVNKNGRPRKLYNKMRAVRNASHLTADENSLAQKRKIFIHRDIRREIKNKQTHNDILVIYLVFRVPFIQTQAYA